MADPATTAPASAVPAPPGDQYEFSKQDRIQSFLNNITGGGNQRVKDMLNEDHARRMAEMDLHRQNMATTGQILASDRDPKTGKPLYQRDAQGNILLDAQGRKVLTPEGVPWQYQYEQAAQNYDKLGSMSKQAKPIVQRELALAGHLIHHGASKSAPAAAGSSPIPSPPTGAASAVAAAPAAPSAQPMEIPPPPGGAGGPVNPSNGATASAAATPQAAPAGVPVSNDPRLAAFGSPVLQKRLEAAEALRAEQLGIPVKAASASAVQQAQLEAQMATRQKFIDDYMKKNPDATPQQAMMYVAAVEGRAMPYQMLRGQHVNVEDPNNPGQPIAATYDPYSHEYLDQNNEVIPNARPLVPSLMPTQTSNTSTYNPDTGTTTTSKTTRKVPLGRNSAVPAPPASGASSAAKPAASASAPASSTSTGSGRIEAMAKTWQDYGTEPGAKDRPAVQKYMQDHDMYPGVKPTNQEVKLADDVKKVEPMVGRLESYLTDNKLMDQGRGGMFSLDALKERGKVQKAWEEYSHGLPPSDKTLGQLVKYAAAIKIMGAAPWMSMARGRWLYEDVVKHLPDTTDTPAQLFDKVQFFKTILEDAKGSLPPQLQRRLGGVPAPPSGTKDINETIMDLVKAAKEKK